MPANSSPTHPQLVFDVGSPIKPLSPPGCHLISILCLLHCAKVSVVILFTQYLALCSYEHLSLYLSAFTTSISYVVVPKSIQEALSQGALYRGVKP